MVDMLQRFLYTTRKPPVGSRVALGTAWSTGLLGYWLFTEHGGAVTRNLFRASGDLVYSGTPEWTVGGAGVSGGTYLEAITPQAIGPLSLTMGVIPRSSGIVRHAQWDQVGPVLYYTGGSLAIVFQNGFSFNPGTVPYTVDQPAVIGLTADGSTARLFCFQNGVFTYAEDTAFGQSYTGFDGRMRVGAGGLNGSGDAANAVYAWVAIHGRALSVPELRAIGTQPYAVLTPPPAWLGREPAAVTVQLVYPTSDVSAGSWTTDTGGTTNLYAAVDESPASDADYMQSSVNPSSDAVELHLGALTPPAVDTGHVLRYRLKRG